MCTGFPRLLECPSLAAREHTTFLTPETSSNVITAYADSTTVQNTENDKREQSPHKNYLSIWILRSIRRHCKHSFTPKDERSVLRQFTLYMFVRRPLHSYLYLTTSGLEIISTYSLFSQQASIAFTDPQAKRRTRSERRHIWTE